MQSDFAVVGHWSRGFDEGPLQAWATDLRKSLSATTVSLGVVFVTPEFFPQASALLELLRVHAQIPLLIGCSTQGLIVGDQELEDQTGLVLGLYHLPGARLQACHFTQSDLEQVSADESWPRRTRIAAEGSQGWLVFLDPFHLEAESWLRSWQEAYGLSPVLGGLASGTPGASRAQVYLDGEVYEEGGVAVSFGGQVQLVGVVSQGCTPIGESWTITKADHNFIREIGNRKAYQILVDTYHALAPEEQKKTRGNLLVGLVINEYLEEYHRGDFLIRNLIGADPNTGGLAVSAWPRAGQTVQFQRRDAEAATDDLVLVLERARQRLGEARIYGGCLGVCNGRGKRLFGEAHHDARLVRQHLGPLPLAGFFCSGEIGPVGDRSFIHGFSVALALMVEK